MIKKFTKGQLNRLSEVLGNVSVAWFSVGIIAPAVNKPRDLVDFFLMSGVSLSIGTVILLGSLALAKKESKG